MRRCGPVRVLVVEDDPIAGADIVAGLRPLGYDVPKVTADIASALIAVERERPQVVLLDIKLAGGGDGIELAQLLRARAPRLALVFLTGCSDRETIDRAVRVRPSTYLIKPFGKDAVYAAVESALQGLPAETEAPVMVAHSARMKRVLALIEDNLHRNLTLADLAREAGLSRDHFGRLFREQLKISPHNYVVQRRMVVARRLLETTDQPILELATEVGYESQGYFTTVFKKECGCTPAAYRRRYRGETAGAV